MRGAKGRNARFRLDTGLYRQMLEAMSDLLIVLDPDGVVQEILSSHEAFRRLFPAEAVGRPIYELVHASEAGMALREAIAHAVRTGAAITTEHAIRLEGREIWFEARVSRLVDEAGRPVGVLLAARDITERHRTLQALEESEARYRSLVEQSNDAIYLLAGRRFHFVNRRFQELLGVTAEEVRDLDFMELVAPQSRPIIEEREERIRRGEPVPFRYEFTARRRDGQEIDLEASVTYIPFEGGIATQGILRDITARKRAEERLLRRERYLACLSSIARSLLQAEDPEDVLPEVLARLGEAAEVSRVYLFENHVNADGTLRTSQRFEWCAPGIEPQIDNPELQGFPVIERGFGRWVDMLGRGEVIVGKVAEFPESERPVLEAQGIVSILVLPLRVRGNLYGFIGFDVCDRVREWEEAEVALLATVANDIAQAIERRQTIAALAESEDRYRHLIDLMPDGVSVHQDGRIRMINRAGATLLGYDDPQELIGRPALEIVHPDDREKVQERIRAILTDGRKVPPLEERLLRRDGTAVEVEVAAGPFVLEGRPAVLVVMRDIATRKRLEEQLRQSQKMEAVGRLAGGVAHDFNNLLTAISGYAEFILNGLPPQDPLRYDAEAILKASERARTLTRQLLAFSRRQVMELKVVDLNSILQDLGRMLRRIIGEDIDMVMALSPDLGHVRVDPSQFEQVVVNLAVNARDAMPTGGQLTLETRNVFLDEAYAQDHPYVRPGEYVLVSVSDTGVGMPPEVREHLFEPFFTTKSLGEGTGLGLATVYGIVKQSGGHIQVYSEVGHGTTFKIYFPRIYEPMEPLEERSPAERLPEGSETVLVVEDNEMVRTLACRVLREQGYTVLEAKESAQALELARKYGGYIHLLLTDVVMPQMSGRLLSETLQQTYPGMQTLYMSGYTDNVVVQHGILEPGVAFIQKPFTPRDLARKVREVLDQAGHRLPQS
ncbi:MAG: PAS domain S-box protein [Chloroflexia bacterium]